MSSYLQKVLKLDLFPDSVFETELKYYLTKMNAVRIHRCIVDYIPFREHAYKIINSNTSLVMLVELLVRNSFG